MTPAYMREVRESRIRYFSHTANRNVRIRWAPACKFSIIGDPHYQNTAPRVSERSQFLCKFATLGQPFLEFDPLAFTFPRQRYGGFAVACQEALKDTRAERFTYTCVRGVSIFGHSPRLSQMVNCRIEFGSRLPLNSRTEHGTQICRSPRPRRCHRRLTGRLGRLRSRHAGESARVAAETRASRWEGPTNARLAARPDVPAETSQRSQRSQRSHAIARTVSWRRRSESYCQDLWIKIFYAAAGSSSSAAASDWLLASGAWPSGRSMSLPLTNTAPARTRATRWGALTARHLRCADSVSL